MPGRLAKVTVYDSRIAALFDTGAPAWTDHQKIMREMRMTAKRMAPRRTGQLAGNTYTNLLRVGRFQARGYLANASDHAAYVVLGTRTPIRPARAQYMVVPKRRGSYRYHGGPINHSLFFAATTVKGQRANDFITRAARLVLQSKR